MAWLWSNVLALTTSVAAGPVGPPLRIAPPEPSPGRTGPELLLPPMAWFWLNKQPATVRVPEFWIAPPVPDAHRLPLQLLPACVRLKVNWLSVILAAPVERMAPPTALPAELPLLPSAPRAWLPVNVLPDTVSEPRFASAPPT